MIAEIRSTLHQLEPGRHAEAKMMLVHLESGGALPATSGAEVPRRNTPTVQSRAALFGETVVEYESSTGTRKQGARQRPIPNRPDAINTPLPHTPRRDAPPTCRETPASLG